MVLDRRGDVTTTIRRLMFLIDQRCVRKRAGLNHAHPSRARGRPPPDCLVRAASHPRSSGHSNDQAARTEAGACVALILMVEHEGEARRRMARLLRVGGYDVTETADIPTALRLMFQSQPDAAIVDFHHADGGGADLIRLLREAAPTAILAITDDTMDTVRALNAGADSVIARRPDAPELLVRLRSLVRQDRRRRESEPGQRIVTGALEIDRDTQTVIKHGTPIPLSRTEYRLLDALAVRVGQTASHRYLLSTVWGDQYVDDTHYLRVYIGYLRQKLEDSPGPPRYLVNDWGVGYRLAWHPVETASGTQSVSASAAAG